MKERKSIRRCEVVTNLKQEDGSDFITLEQVESILKEKSSCIKDFAYIIHDKDTYSPTEAKTKGVEPGSLKPAHIHWLLRFNDDQPQHLEDIAKWCGLPVNMIEKIKGKWEDAVAYLIHANAPDKYQYSVEKVNANFNITDSIEKVKSQKSLDTIIHRILTGEIREYNKASEIDGLMLVYKSRQIREAFKVRQEALLATEQERNTDVIFITGKSGSGKTTLAKRIAKERGLAYYVSSGSNDVMDGYLQQPCLILDDIRPSCLGLSDLLKLLDNNTATSIKSRYKNKYLNCDLIILTSVLSLDDFYHNVFEHENEPIQQLKRRCGTYIRMDADMIEVSVWDKRLMRYTKPTIYENDIINDYLPDEPVNDADVQEKVDNLIPFLKPMVDENLVNQLRSEMQKHADKADETISNEDFFHLMPVN